MIFRKQYIKLFPFSNSFFNVFFTMKMLEENSDLKTQQAFEAVIRLLKTCKEEVVERLFR